MKSIFLCSADGGLGDSCLFLAIKSKDKNKSLHSILHFYNYKESANILIILNYVLTKFVFKPYILDIKSPYVMSGYILTNYLYFFMAFKTSEQLVYLMVYNYAILDAHITKTFKDMIPISWRYSIPYLLDETKLYL